MRESNIERVASHGGSEPCEGGSEALDKGAPAVRNTGGIGIPPARL
jgi:hypothetical protein